MNLCELATMPFFAAFQYSACNGLAEETFPDFLLSLILCFPSVLLEFLSDLTKGVLEKYWCKFKVSLIICSSDFIRLWLPVPLFLLNRYY